MTTKTMLTIVTTLALAACQQTPPDRHALWTGAGVPISNAKLISTHDSKAACAAARDQFVKDTAMPDDITTPSPDSTGTIWVGRRGVVTGYVCHPVGVNPR